MKITPPDSLLPRLRGLKGYRLAGVIDDLFVRAMVIGNGENRAALISFDLNTAPCTQEFLEELSAEAGIPVENILYFATHTHAVPVVEPDRHGHDAPPPDVQQGREEYIAFVQEQTRAALKQALATMEPARMGYAFGESAINVVRLQEYTYRDENGVPFPVCNLGADPTAPADRTQFLLRVEALDGRPLAFLVNYAMHNVATIWNDFDGTGAMGISSDIGGRISKLLEEQYGGVALWSSGAAGDLNPLMLNEVILPDPVTGRTYETHPKGVEPALTALKIMSERNWADVQALARAVRCEESEGEVAAVLEWSVTPGCACIRHHGAPPEFITGPDVPEHTVRLQMVRIGSLTLCGAGTELYSSIGAAMRAAMPQPAVLITLNAGELCSSHYVLDDAAIARCDASRGFAMVPGYDEFRCCAGVMEDDLTGHVRHMAQNLA
ncbi:MAG: hypothetical protein ACI3XJ_13715 [Oscillospiraceae bacterium]